MMILGFENILNIPLNKQCCIYHILHISIFISDELIFPSPKQLVSTLSILGINSQIREAVRKTEEKMIIALFLF